LAQYSEGLSSIWASFSKSPQETNLLQLSVDDNDKKDQKKRNESWTAKAGSWMADNLASILGTKK